MLRLVRKHSSGKIKIYDRKPDVDGKFKEVIHRLTVDDVGKTFEVHDEAYVLKRHGAILEKVTDE